MIVRVIIFLIINFAGLAIGSLFTSAGVSSEWYEGLNKAPWTPPGWVFGAAWTTIMVCFAIYMAALWPKEGNRRVLITLFAVQWILNAAWNPVFFKFQLTWAGLIVIISLTMLVGYFLFKYRRMLGTMSLLILPYFIWLILATSLNAYICFMN